MNVVTKLGTSRSIANNLTDPAKLLGEDENWLHELSIDMFPEDGCLHVYGVGEDGVTAFTPNSQLISSPDIRDYGSSAFKASPPSWGWRRWC